jgi:co-chaperonin GroES (HSP10)
MSEVLTRSGTRLEAKTQYLPAGTKLRPLRDRMVVRPLSWQPSAIIEIAGDARKPLRGEVVAIGPGQRQKRYYRNANGEVHKMGETGRVIPTEVKVGDVVELGGLEIDGYGFPEIVIGTERFILCQEQDVAGVVES